MRRGLACAAMLAALTALGGCASVKVTEDTPTSVAVRYDGVAESLADATAVANKTCAAYGKTARLRENTVRAILQRIAHFDCVSS